VSGRRRHRQTRVFVKQFLNDYVFKGRRLGSHPALLAFVGRVRGNVLAVSEITRQDQMLNDCIPLKGSISGMVFRASRGVSVSNVSAAKEYYLCADCTRSEIAVPLLTGKRTFGVLNIESVYEDFFTNADLKHAELLAQLLAAAECNKPGALQFARLGLALSRKRDELGLTHADVESRMPGGGCSLHAWENGLLPSSLEALYEWCRALGIVQPRETAVVSLVDLTPQLLALLRDDPAQLRRLTPEQFELFVTERLDRIGYDVTLTGNASARDGGIDLVAVPKRRGVGSFLLAGQIKHHEGAEKVKRSEVDRLLAWKESPFRLGLLVTNTFFTRDALWLASQLKHRDFLRLRDFDDLKRWIGDNFSADEDWREIPDSITLAPGVRVKIPKPRSGD
jgi:hypothetical protein